MSLGNVPCWISEYSNSHDVKHSVSLAFKSHLFSSVFSIIVCWNLLWNVILRLASGIHVHWFIYDWTLNENGWWPFLSLDAIGSQEGTQRNPAQWRTQAAVSSEEFIWTRALALSDLDSWPGCSTHYRQISKTDEQEWQEVPGGCQNMQRTSAKRSQEAGNPDLKFSFFFLSFLIAISKCDTKWLN